MNKNSRTIKSVVNIAISLLSSLLLVILNYFGRVIFVRFLDESYLGINGLFTNIISILSIADLGIVTTLTFSLYKPLKDKDEIKINSLIGFFRKVYLIIAVVVLVFGLCLIPVLPFIVNLENTPEDIYLYYVLFVLESATSYLFVYKSILMTADQKNYVMSLVDIGLNVTRFVSRILILIFTRNYLLYVAIGVLLNIVFNFIRNIIANRKYPFLRSKAEPLSKLERKEIFTNVKATFFYKIGGVIQSNTDSILISIFVGTITVGYYSNYILIVNSVITFVTVIFTALKASLGSFIQDYKNDPEKSYQLYKALDVGNYWLICFCSVAFICLFQDFTVLSYGEQYLLPIIIVIVIVLNFYTSNVRQNIWAFRETTGLFKKTRYITLVTAIINLVLSIILGYFFGLIGILGSTVIARMVYAFWREPVILYNDVFHKSSKSYFITYLLQFLLFAFVCSLTYVSCYFIKLDNLFLEFFIKIVLVVLIPNIILLLVYIKNKDFKLLLSRVLNIFKKGEANA